MPSSMTFSQFAQRLESDRLSDRALAQLLEMDPTATKPQVRFRLRALKDHPPAEYDVDEALYEWQQRRERRVRKGLRGAKARRPLVVAEGDSWFNLPPIIRPAAIADRMKANGVFTVANIAHWGDTIADMLRRKQYLDELAQRPAAWFTLSAGGNDMQSALAGGGLLLTAAQAPPDGPWLSPEGRQVLATIGDGYQQLLTEVTQQFPTQKVLCYCYDYPKPQTGNGKYIGRYLEALGYKVPQWNRVVHSLMEELATIVRRAIAPFPNVVFLDCFGMAQATPWFDDMHPDTAGFKALAKAFETRMLPPPRARTPRRRPKRAKPKAGTRTKAARHR